MSNDHSDFKINLADELSDIELEQLASRIDQGYVLPRAGDWRSQRSPQSEKAWTPPRTSRPLLSDDAFRTHLESALKHHLTRRLAERPRPTNDQAVNNMLQRLCAGDDEVLTVQERQRFLESAVSVMEEAIEESAKEAQVTSTDGSKLSTVGDPQSDGSAPDTNRLSFHTAVHRPAWVLACLAAIRAIRKSLPEAAEIFCYSEFASLSEDELADCFRRPINEIEQYLDKVRTYLRATCKEVKHT